jgi:dolichyl-phosphate beta-glucosyltransferase
VTGPAPGVAACSGAGPGPQLVRVRARGEGAATGPSLAAALAMATARHRPTLSVIVPAYDEATRIAPTLHRICAYLEARPEPYEVIVVDDGSRDATRAIVTGVAARAPRVRLLALARNRGKGAAVRAGVLASRGDEVLFTDADLSTPIEELARLRAALAAGADLAIGSRAAPGDVLRRQPRRRRLQGRAFRLVVAALGFRSIARLRDTQCGFKLLRGDVARRLFAQLTLTGFAFDVELLALAHPRHRVAEIAVAWRHADGSKVRPGVDALRMVRDLAHLRLRWAWRGRPRALPAAGRQVAG